MIDENVEEIEPGIEDDSSKMVDGEPYLCNHLRGCARCRGEGHDNLTFQPLQYPIRFGDGYVATHWCPCPTNGQPILNGRAPLVEIAKAIVKAHAAGEPLDRLLAGLKAELDA